MPKEKGKAAIKNHTKLGSSSFLSSQFFVFRHNNNIITLNHHLTDITSLTRVTTAYKRAQENFPLHIEANYSKSHLVPRLDFISTKTRMHHIAVAAYVCSRHMLNRT
jgi:hypothetical protein